MATEFCELFPEGQPERLNPPVRTWVRDVVRQCRRHQSDGTNEMRSDTHSLIDSAGKVTPFIGRQDSLLATPACTRRRNQIVFILANTTGRPSGPAATNLPTSRAASNHYESGDARPSRVSEIAARPQFTQERARQALSDRDVFGG